MNRQTFVGELIDDVEHAEPAAIMGAIFDEVIGPDVIGTLRGPIREKGGHWQRTFSVALSPRRLRAAGLQTQRPSLALLVTEEPSLADLHAGRSEARFGHQEIPVHRDERQLFLC